MKVIRHGYLSDNGIHIKCEYCGCEYMIENRNDWQTRIIERWDFSHKYIEYSVVCPDCSNEKYFGIDTNIYNANEDDYMIGHPIFNRPDWAERYEVKIDGKNNV